MLFLLRDMGKIRIQNINFCVALEYAKFAHIDTQERKANNFNNSPL